MKAISRLILLAALLAMSTSPLFGQVEGPFTRLYEVNERLFPVDPEFKGEFQCLEYCVELEVQIARFECAPVLAPPTTRCPLPWIDAGRPTPMLPWDPMEWCIPEEPEFIGYHLHEDRSKVSRLVRHESSCKTTHTDTVLQVLPDQGHPTGRSCPDAGGPWIEELETITAIRFTSCP